MTKCPSKNKNILNNGRFGCFVSRRFVNFKRWQRKWINYNLIALRFISAGRYAKFVPERKQCEEGKAKMNFYVELWKIARKSRRCVVVIHPAISAWFMHRSAPWNSEQLHFISCSSRDRIMRNIRAQSCPFGTEILHDPRERVDAWR